MTFDQAAVIVVIAITMALFIWGRWRYDIVALSALLVVVHLGIVAPGEAFSGFGHPAVITVAAVLVISRAMQASGVVDHLVRLLAPTRRGAIIQIAGASSLAAVLSAFMNNVGALALMLPVTLRNAYRAGRPASQVLMPLSFATLLGGLITLIGTPPNIVIAAMRARHGGEPFQMFDFAPVGLAVAAVGLLFVSTLGWRLLPRQRAGQDDGRDLFHIEAYIIEARVPEDSVLVGETVRHIERLCENEVTIMAVIHGRRRTLAPGGGRSLAAGDILILEGDPSALAPLLEDRKLEQTGHDVTAEDLRSDEIRVVEAVLMPNSPIEGQSMRGLRMHDRYGINLLAVARQGKAPLTRLGSIRFKTGDVLLLQGERDTMQQTLAVLGCLPLADRGLRPTRRRRIFLPIGIFGCAVVAAAYGLVPVQIAFVTAVVALVLTKTLSLRGIYDSIEWPVILLLGALIPIGEALQATGGTTLISDAIIGLAGDLPTWAMLALIMVSSMILSDLIHNTPTAVLMAPIGATVAVQLGLPVEPFLMAVAVGAASPFLTPIGHQSNTLVMGPGGYQFSDYARMGIPLDILIVLVGVPMIMWVWLP